MKLADYVIKFLADRGVHKIFMVYGSAMGDLCDAFTRVKNTEYVAMICEQAGGFAAEGYAKVSGRPGAMIVTSGPGGMNLVTPLGNCFYDSVPCVFITGQINSRFLRPDPAIRQVGFQETDIVAIAKPLTKYAKMITDAKSIRYELERAWWLAQEGRPGPVLLDLPMDIQKADVDPDRLHGFDPFMEGTRYDDAEIVHQAYSFLRDLEQANRPVILVGGGVRLSNAVDFTRDVITKLGVPVFPTWNALDVITSDYSLYGGRVGTYGGAGRNFGIQNCDLLLALGSRLSGRITGGAIASFARAAKRYLVDVDPALLQPQLQQLPFHVNVRADVGQFIGALNDAIAHRPSLPDFGPWRKRVTEWRDKYDPVQARLFGQEAIHPYAFVRQLSSAMGTNDVLVADCGGNIVVCNHSFQTKYGQRYLTNNGNSPMGFSMAGAMGAWFADPSRRVVCVIGDGGFQVNIQELQTIKHYNVNIKVFILNNHCYGITKLYQKTNFGGREEACGPKGYSVPENFSSIAQAYGIKGIGLAKTDAIDVSIMNVLYSDGPVVVDVDIGDFSSYEPRISGWNTPIEDMTPRLPREEFRVNMIIDPLPGWDKDEYE